MPITSSISLAHDSFVIMIIQGVACDLLTGKEKLWASGSASQPASHLACTVEMSALEVTEPCEPVQYIQYDVCTDTVLVVTDDSIHLTCLPPS